MPRVLLDTQSFYDYVMNFDAMVKSAQEIIRSAAETGELAVSAMTVLEIREMRNSGRLTAQRIEELDDFLSRVPAHVEVVPIVLEIIQAMDHFDNSISVPDRLIGATAKHGNMTLMTDSEVFDPTEVHVQPTRREHFVIHRHRASP